MKEEELSSCFTNPAGCPCDQDGALWLGHPALIWKSALRLTAMS
ncbi:hypothetical protein OAE23_02215 [Synechococcus sp. AH-551-E11]|nr:hypothetical protein [Synechococcus sp. AH-551-E11]